MHRQQPYIVILALALLASACQFRGAHKPLMGGIRPSKEAVIPVEEPVEVGEPAAGELKTADLLPAPLTDRPEQLLHRLAYTASYNRETRNPNWVQWTLTADHTSGPYKRKGVDYQEDADVPEPRAGKWDYYNSGFDRGHMCPSGDNKWSAQAQRECFYYTNMCPQNHALNGGDWNELEMKCRAWASRYGTIHIVCGPIYQDGNRRAIGQNKVAVPTAFYKVVLRLGELPAALGFIYANEGEHRSMGSYVLTLREVEEQTGISFFSGLDKAVRRQVEDSANLSDW